MLTKIYDGTTLSTVDSVITDFWECLFASEDRDQSKDSAIWENLSKFEVDPIPYQERFKGP